MPETPLIQDTFWILGVAGWLIAAGLAARLVSAGESRRRHRWLALAGATAAGAANLWHFLTFDLGTPAALVRADLIAGGLTVLAATCLGLSGTWRWLKPGRERGGALLLLGAAALLLWPGCWITLGWAPALLRTDFLPFGAIRGALALTIAWLAVAIVWRAAPRPKARRHLVPCWFAAVGVAGALLTEVATHFTHARLRETALARVRSLTFALDAEAVATLPTDATTPRSPQYAVLRAQLLRLRRANPDVAYLYLVQPLGGNLVYPVSGAEGYQEIAGGPILSDPGEAFETGGPIGPELAAMFATAQPYLSGLTRDPVYGTLITAYAPVPAPDGGSPRKFLAMDFRPVTFRSAIRQTRLLTFGLMGVGLAAVLLFLRYQINGEAAAAAREAHALADQRERSRNEFLGQVSHELQTPLHAILAQTTELARQPGAAVRESAAEIAEQSGQLQRLIEDLLQSSALQSPAFRLWPAVCDLPALLRDLAAHHAGVAAAKGLRFEVRLDPLLPRRVRTDRLRFRQIIGNLLHNAVKYTAAGGVTLAAKPAASGGGRVELVIADTGCGLPADLQGRLFEPFARGAATAALPGAGLGLSVAQALCLRMNGELNARPAAPRGTEFVVTLPLEVAGPETPSTDGPARDLLLVEDHPTLREHLAGLLRELGWNVASTDNLEEAQRLAHEHPPRAALVDLHLGTVSTLPLLVELAARQPRPWVGAISASRDPQLSEAALAAGADDFLFKPITAGALAEALAAVSPHQELDARTRLARAFAARDSAAAKAAAHEGLNTAIATSAADVEGWRELERLLGAGDWETAERVARRQCGVAGAENGDSLQP